MLNRVSISTLLKTVIATLGAGIVVMLTIQAWESWGRLAATSRAVAASDAAGYMFTALHNLRVDRSLTYNDLASDSQAGASASVVKARAEEMQALKAALEPLSRVDFPDQQILIGELIDHTKRLTALQEETTAALQQPKPSRRSGLGDEFVREANTLLGVLDKLSSRVTASIKLQDSFIDELMELKQIGWTVRNAGGDTVAVVSNILQGRPAAPNALDDYVANVGRLNTGWALLKDLAVGLPLPPRFAEAVATADGEFFGPDFTVLRTKTLKALLAGQSPGVTNEQWTPMTIAKLVAVENVAQTALDIARERAADQHARALRELAIELGLIAAAVALAVGMMAVVSRRVTRPLFALSEAMRRLADGDFTVTMPDVGRKDEVGMIVAAAEAVVDRVGATIGNIKVAANEVTNASAEISTSTTDLSQRTEEQAASLEETSASLEEIAETVRRNAENAQQANAFATETSAVAERGGAVVGSAVTAMARIEESSRKISDIIGVIDEIARQTNLLALNAAVEAARAGEAGRGFAVVASEVRSLAQRSSQAAKDIKDLIVNSSSQVKDGVELVNKAGQSLNEIVASIKKVATIVAEIANASAEQSTGIEQVNKALSQMDEVTQQNSALVEENAATAKTLEHQAKSMDQRVAAFRLRAVAMRGAGASESAMTERAASSDGSSSATPHPPTVAPFPVPAEAKRQPVATPKRAIRGGPIGRMQTALATALDADADWKEF
jgi:methyl-accepting chemotaxis protein